MLSIIVPVYNERESLDTLHEELCQMATAQGYELELVFVDDGSTDASWAAIERLAQRDPRVRGIRFRRNFGKAAALRAGFAEARGERAMTLDADLQDDPQEIPRFMAALDQGLDLVSGWKQVRHDPWHKVGPSRVFNWMVSRLTGVVLHDHNCGMKGYRRAVFEEIPMYGELHRFVPVLAAARGFRVGELVIQHRSRRFGHSKYGLTRFLKGFLDLLTVTFLTRYGQRPMHLLGSLGLGAFALGVILFVSLASHRAILSMGMLLLGSQLLGMGLVAELVVAYHQRELRSYAISERTPSASDDPPASATPS